MSRKEMKSQVSPINTTKGGAKKSPETDDFVSLIFGQAVADDCLIRQCLDRSTKGEPQNDASENPGISFEH